MKQLLYSTLLLCLFTVTVSGQTIYVDGSASGDNNGTSWADAYTSLHDALDSATDGSEIWVAAGTYQPGSDTSDYFTVGTELSLYGGFDGSDYTIATFADGMLTGAFSTVTGVSENNYQVNYNPDSITLTLIPEPASLALMGLGGVLLLGRGRRAGQ